MALRVLVVRLSALGDTALTLPLLRELRLQLPDAHLGWVVGGAAAPLLEGDPALDRLHVLDRKGGLRALARTVREIRAERYDVSLDVQGLTKSAVLPFLARVGRRVGLARGRVEGRELSGVLSTELVRPPAERTSVVGRQLSILSALGLDAPARAPRGALAPDAAALARMRDWWQEKLGGGRAPGHFKTLALGVGAGWPTKVVPPERLAALVRAAADLGLRCVFVWGPAERDSLGELAAALGPLVVVSPPTTVREMVALLALADAYAGPDSAALHVAALLGRPTFSWFGASDPARCAPELYVPEELARTHRYVAKALPCRPCWKRSCPSRSCVLDLDEAELVEPFVEWLRSVPNMNA